MWHGSFRDDPFYWTTFWVQWPASREEAPGLVIFWPAQEASISHDHELVPILIGLDSYTCLQKDILYLDAVNKVEFNLKTKPTVREFHISSNTNTSDHPGQTNAAWKPGKVGKAMSPGWPALTAYISTSIIFLYYKYTKQWENYLSKLRRLLYSPFTYFCLYLRYQGLLATRGRKQGINAYTWSVPGLVSPCLRM